MKYFFLFLSSLFFFPLSSFAFSDVSETHENYEAIMWAEENRIVKGFDDGTFRPENKVTRAELLKIIFLANSFDNQMRTGNEGVDPNCFPDTKNNWYTEWICLGKKRNIVNGFPDGNFYPHKNISFVAAAKIIANVMSEEKIEEDSEVWYRNYVQFLSDKRAIPVSILELDKEITRGEMVEMVWRLNSDVLNSKSIPSMYFYKQENIFTEVEHLGGCYSKTKKNE